MKNVKIKMIRSEKGSPDGIAVKLYREGEVYDVPVDLAECFLSIRAAKALTRAEAATSKPKAKPKAKAAPVAKMTGPTENK